jgi:molybdopterin molybdotransferase
MKFLKVDTLENARQRLLKHTESWLLQTETAPLGHCLGRVLAADIFAAEDMPAFRRSTVDGYAIISKDTRAAGEAMPSFFRLIGSVEMGEAANFNVTGGTCCEVPTGAMLPEGCDAVVMLEYCEPFGTDSIAVYRSAAHGENVVNIGDDARRGELLLPRGKLLEPQDIGVLAAAGRLDIPVYAPPV